MDIKQNTSYSPQASPKAYDPSKFKGLRQSVQSAPQKSVAPAQAVAEPKMDMTQVGNVTTNPGEPTRGEEDHPGIDIAGSQGTPVPAAQSGVVTEAVNGKKQGDPDFGNYAIITDRFGNKFRYSHLQNSWVKAGDQVQQGQPVGGMGDSGNTYSPTGGDPTHVDIRVKDIYGRYVDPNDFLTANR